MFKKILPYALTVIFAIGIFILGFYTGINFFASIKSTTMLQEAFIVSSEMDSVLNYLDQEEVEKARQFLLLKQDGTIISINNLSEHADKESYATACHILKRIAQNRKDDPTHYAAYTYGNGIQEFDVIKKEVGRILDKWVSTSCDKN